MDGSRIADPHLAQAGVDVRVVDDFTGQEDLAIGEAAARLVGVVDGPVDAVTKAEFARQLQADAAGSGIIAERLHAFDGPAPIRAFQSRTDLRFEAKAFLEIAMRHGSASISEPRP